MHKYFLLFIFIASLQLTQAQEITSKEAELKTLLCKKWDIDFAKIGEMKMGQMPDAADFDITFFKDGTYEIVNVNGESKKGKWTYYPEKQFVQLEINERKNLRVIKISEDKLVCSSTPGTDGPPMNVEIHFKSIN